ncbi:methyltransferase domain-containing protein [Anaeromyxobacter oryzisoli]|uniref:hypothetical protein n=1 Tax=Anaeromyxobacter oryzisoli TaxID=2925408 RepID=UPI001F55F97B|nr:hypothetical protein [Anaeromyxobacter sp. SG63]
MSLNLFAAIRNRILYHPTWRDADDFDEIWKQRIELLASFISQRGVVADFGCGMMWLERYLPPACTYLPLDLHRRDDRTVIFDANRDAIPDRPFAIAFLSGMLEYVASPEGFFGQLIERRPSQIVMSYVSTDLLPGRAHRRSLHWQSHLSTREILSRLVGPYRLSRYQELRGNQLFSFEVAQERHV